jgi:tetratricopeptide (TPR) repeat protein
VSCFAFAQRNKRVVDSLLNLSVKVVDDTLKARLFNQISYQYLNVGQFAKALEYADKALQLSEKAGFKKGVATALNYTGMANERQGNYKQAEELYLKVMEIWEELNNKIGIGNVYINIGNIYTNKGEYEQALSYYYKSLAIWELIDNKRGEANVYMNMGNIYLAQKKYEFALRDYFKVLKIWEGLNDKKGIADICNNLGNAYRNIGQKDSSLNYQLKALRIREEIGDSHGLSSSYNNVGLAYMERKDFKKSLESHFKSLQISQNIGNKAGIGNSYCNIALVYIEQKKFDEAEISLQKSLDKFKEIGFKEAVKEALSCFAQLYETKGDFKKAFEYGKLYSEMKDSLLNEQMSRQITEMDVKYDSEKKDKELIKKDAEIVRQQSEADKKNLQRNAFIIGFLLVLTVAFFVLRSYNRKKAANIQLEGKNQQIEKQKKLVEEKNAKITDSITYAKRIQHATLPSEGLIKAAFPDSFVLFLPKDIVSGDFYWYSRLSAGSTPTYKDSSLSESESSDLIVVADCTGHGVPGAFMSMIGNTLLNEIVNVKKIHSPSLILNELNKSVINLLHQGNAASETQDDGMDISLLKIDSNTQELEFAAANHYSYLLVNNKAEQLNGDIYSIGGMFGSSHIRFESRKIKMEKGSSIYLFTDGFMDQFGGEKNSKYSASRFEAFLLSICNRRMEEQKVALQDEFEKWKGQNKQLDDILIIGLQF